MGVGAVRTAAALTREKIGILAGVKEVVMRPWPSAAEEDHQTSEFLSDASPLNAEENVNVGIVNSLAHMKIHSR